jgi:hypothetical protein
MGLIHGRQNTKSVIISYTVVLGILVVSVLAIRPKVRGFIPSRGRWIFSGEKIHSTPSFGRREKPLVPSRKILRHVKCPSKYESDTSQGKIHNFLRKFLLLCWQMTMLVGLPESSGWRIRSFRLSISFHHGSRCSYITCEMNKPVGGRSSET